MVIIPWSSVTLTSSFLTAGSCARIRYSASVSLMSALGAQVSFSPFSNPTRADRLNRLGISRPNASSSSPKGCHLMRLMFVPLVSVMWIVGLQHRKSRRAKGFDAARSCIRSARSAARAAVATSGLLPTTGRRVTRHTAVSYPSADGVPMKGTDPVLDEVEEMFARIDLDGDQSIGFEEFA